MVQLDHIRPVCAGRRHEVAPGGGVPFRVFDGEVVVPGSVVGDPVQDHVHAAVVDCVDQPPEILMVAEFGIDALVVPDRVVAAEAAQAVLLADRVDGHEPQDAHAHILQTVKVRLERFKGALLRVLADVHLVHGEIAGPGAVVLCRRKRWQQEQDGENDP